MQENSRQTQWGEWLEDSSRGDRKAFSQLYEATGPHLFGLALRILKKRDLAEEALQDSFLKIWNRAADFDPGRGRAFSWMAAIVRNTCLDRLRKSSREPLSRKEFHEELRQSQSPGPSEWVAGAEEARALQRCLETLGEEERNSLWLAYWQGLSHSELARYWDRPLGTVKTWVRRGLERLRNCLES